MQLTNLFLLMVPYISNFVEPTNLGVAEKDLMICYGKLDSKNIKGFKIVILEPEHYSKEDVEAIKNQNEKVVAYISLTEINTNSRYYKDLLPYTIGTNKVWESSYISLKEEEARCTLLSIVNDITDKGFNGLFMDNLDNVSDWGPLPSQRTELLDFISEIRQTHKGLFLIQNSGLFLAEALNEVTDAILVESLFSLYDFDAKNYGFRDSKSTNHMLKSIQHIQKNHHKKIFILEYADSLRMKSILSKKLDSLKMVYYISQIDLQQEARFN